LNERRRKEATWRRSAQPLAGSLFNAGALETQQRQIDSAILLLCSVAVLALLLLSDSRKTSQMRIRPNIHPKYLPQRSRALITNAERVLRHNFDKNALD
jgi:hypothetical protein